MDSASLLTCLLLSLSFIVLFIVGLRLICKMRRVPGSFAFFHPYCNAGGGGERVLWLSINAMQKRFNKVVPDLKFVIYTGDIDQTLDQILEKAHSRFGISIRAENVRLVHLRWRWILEAHNYPHFTMLGQLLAGFLLAIECLWRHCPQWFMDTTGCPLTLPLFRWIAGAQTMCYVHYPTITTEMIHLVKSRTSTYNNSPGIATNPMLSALKLLYYRLIALLYAACGKCSQLTIVNGSWTAGHISTLWGCDPQKVYPPCDIDTLVALEQKGEEILEQRKQILILSVGQIRPEKDHPKQIQIFAELKRQLEERGSQIKAKLVFAGGCRNEVDRNRVGSLKSYALNNFQLDSADEIVDEEQQDLIWRLNIPFKELTTLLQESFIGLHTMWNEHFGISVVEKMAAGLLMVAHNSGGPKLDIIGDSDLTENEIVLTSGFLADTKEEYVTKILTILLDMGRSERDQIRANAREKVKRFSDGRFEEQFCDVVEPMVRGRRTQSIKSEEEKE